MTRCRLCRESLDDAPRLTIDPAPSGAQHFAKSAERARQRAIALIVVECRTCGLVQSVSRPVTGHRRAITAAGVSGPMREHRLAQAQRLSAQLGRPGGRLALIGCGNGYELPILAEAGFSPEGIEYGGAPKKYTGTWPIHDGYPKAGFLLPAAPYDAFASYNFLEHAPEPRGFLSAVCASLTGDGVGVVEVPNYTRQRAESRAADYIADHLSYFTADTLRVVLTVSGFDVLTVSEVRVGENIEALVRRRAPSALVAEERLLMAARSAVHGFFASWRARGTGAVAWGASHQALTLFAGAPPDGVPSAILDSAPFKRGRFAPASGIAVVAPSKSALAGVGVVLVIASGYEREISRSLRETLGFAGEIWTVRGHELFRLD